MNSSARSDTPASAVEASAGGASLFAKFTSNLPQSAVSVAFTFNGSDTSIEELPASCHNTSSCSVTAGAPPGKDQLVQALLYSASGGSGSQLAVGTGKASFYAGQHTTLSFPLQGIMASFEATVNPNPIIVGQSTPLTVTEQAFDAAGDLLAPGYVTASLQAPVFEVSPTPIYSGIGRKPSTLVVSSTGYPNAEAPLSFASPTPFTIGFALGNAGMGAISLFPAGIATAAREYSVPFQGQLVFDAHRTLWYETSSGYVGITDSSTNVAPLAIPGTLLAFDESDRAYVWNANANALEVYAGTKEVRHIFFSAGKPQCMAVDTKGRLYVGHKNGISEYGESGDIYVKPIVVNPLASCSVAADAAGNVYAEYSSTVGMWPAGTFGSDAPAGLFSPSIFAEPNLYEKSFAVDPTGNVYALTNGNDTSPTVWYAPAGAGAFTTLDVPGLYAKDQPVIAAPIK